ncbi:ATP-dependent helicase [Mycobacterium sp. CBMA271]|uniref:ATP-dependent helicase n=1 Tax=unclassified Mycobacteroides TaxID=2618759 RepID=UPI00132A65DC|nr:MULTISPECIES: ATP-dependent DNA helicase [unclassified Mycobacteroides]MUM16543.1 ATP-dependent DNA helicase [Mycobacteroides sp. CBMA 326]MUM20510.1 ATP-dependent helicase [Mycobacteroides sp. CBMA 271]
MSAYTPAELSRALGIFEPTEEQAAVIGARPGPMVVIAGAGAGKTETMAARVVWLVANGYATPGQVLGLTFTRKAAGQLLRRVRSRLARLAGSGILPPVSTDEPDPVIGTYHAYAGTLLREHGLLLPMEPNARLLTETQLWQLAFRLVCDFDGDLDTEKTPGAVTAQVLALAGQLSEHLVDTADLLSSHDELEQLIHTLPPGPYQREGRPSAWLLRLVETQCERTQLVAIVDRLLREMRTRGVLDFGTQMSLAARLAAEHSVVGQTQRERYRVVLLDEYQDTGHAQRILLSSLFGRGVDPELALTAVGDPIQSIYGWRGASATNLPRFTTDFPLADGSPAPTRELRTSWRNPPEALHLANAVSEEARRRSVAVRPLRPRPDAPSGHIACALLGDIAAEREWVATQMASVYEEARREQNRPPSSAVLVRRNSDAAPMAEVLAAHGVPVEVVGLTGLLGLPEVADTVAMLRLVADPTAGPAALRVLTGPRWRLGAHDLAVLWRRATAFGRGVADVSGEEADIPCLADAVSDPGAAEQYSPEGWTRLTALRRELSALRTRLGMPLTDLIAEVQRVLALDVELVAGQRAGGLDQLRAFTDVAAGFAEAADQSDPVGVIAAFLQYLDAAWEIEKGFTPAEVAASPGRVQILTVHSAKGLEWDVVAVPHVSAGVFPSGVAAPTWLTSATELPPLLRGDRATDGDRFGVPQLNTEGITNRKQLSDAIARHKDSLATRRIDEERRLLYVAVTRSAEQLFVSGHHWGQTGLKPKGPSDFLNELRDVIEDAAAEVIPCGIVEQWAPEPAAGERNPMLDQSVEAQWPADPLADRRSEVEAGARLVREARAGVTAGPDDEDDDDMDGWTADVDALLREREQAHRRPELALPQHLSVTSLVELRHDPQALARRLARPRPSRPDLEARRGTAFHSWVQRHYGSVRLIDFEDLPSDGYGDFEDAEDLAALQSAFLDSDWADRTPADVEVPFEISVSGTVLRGRIDAVFGPDSGTAGTWTVVDWKTGHEPSGAEMEAAALQLAVYRQAWAALQGIDPARVNAVFHYVRTGRTVAPAELPELPREAELSALGRE